MNIRRATLSDMEGINNLLRQVLMVHHNGRPDLFKANVKKYTDEELEAIIADDKRPIFVATDDGANVLGYAFCVYQQHVNDNVLTDVRTLYIDDICVDEGARGQRVGTKIYEHVKAFAKAEGFYNVTLNVWSLNPVAQSFYESLGMKPYKVGMEEIL